jgi:hypothetical protein
LKSGVQEKKKALYHRLFTIQQFSMLRQQPRFRGAKQPVILALGVKCKDLYISKLSKSWLVREPQK